MNNRKIVISSITALMIVAGNAIAAETSPFPSSAHEVGGHWTGKVGRDSTPGMNIAVFPSAAMEFSSVGEAHLTARPAMRSAGSERGTAFPSAAVEVSGRAI